MRKTFILDFEATGVEATKARPLEVAIYEYDITIKDTTTKFVSVMFDSDYPVIGQEILDLTHITREELATAPKPKEVLDHVCKMVAPDEEKKASVIVAHNAHNYDEVLFKAECERLGLTPPELIWVDTMQDLPGYEKCRVLSHMALEHGFTVDPSILHRAAADVELLSKIIGKYDFKDLFRRAVAKKITIAALVSYDEKEKAKKKGFRWQKFRDNAPNFPKRWVKEIPEFLYPEEEKTCDFQIEIL